MPSGSRIDAPKIEAEVTLRVQFYDLDPMQVVWHGNYPRYLEQARCALLDKIGYNYTEMADSGFLWPIVDLRIKYVRPLRFNQDITVHAQMMEYENRLRIAYRILDTTSGAVLTKAWTIQVAVSAATQELCMETPCALQDRVRRFL